MSAARQNLPASTPAAPSPSRTNDCCCGLHTTRHDTHLHHRERDDEQPKHRVHVVLHRAPPAPERPQTRLEEVHGQATRELDEVQHEDGDAPFLVRVVDRAGLCEVDGVDA